MRKDDKVIIGKKIGNKLYSYEYSIKNGLLYAKASVRVLK